jgi:aspartyl-tRNA(Asn)/glutamyl-tRNA(Gln) amidotransferase subunit B
MRGKEEANDYRYFPDPDLLPLIVDAELKAQVREQLPELPDEKRERFVLHLGLSRYDAGVLTSSRELADYYEVMLAEGVDAKLSANWVMGDLAAFLNKDALEITQSPVSAQQLAQLVARISDNTLSGTLAKKVFEHLWNRDGETVDAIIESKGLKQISDSGALEQIIDAIMAANPQQVEQFRAGKDKLMGFFVGQAMKASKGQANPAQLNELLKKKLAG